MHRILVECSDPIRPVISFEFNGEHLEDDGNYFNQFVTAAIQEFVSDNWHDFMFRLSIDYPNKCDA